MLPRLGRSSALGPSVSVLHATQSLLELGMGDTGARRQVEGLRTFIVTLQLAGGREKNSSQRPASLLSF